LEPELYVQCTLQKTQDLNEGPFLCLLSSVDIQFSQHFTACQL